MSNFRPVSSIAAPEAAILKRDSESGVRLMQTAIFTAGLPCEKIHISVEGGRGDGKSGDRWTGRREDGKTGGREDGRTGTKKAHRLLRGVPFPSFRHSVIPSFCHPV